MANTGKVHTDAKKKSIYTSNVHSDNLSVKVSTLHNEKLFFDVTLICGVDEISIPAHRLVLIASSDFFLAAFRSNLDETNKDKIKLPEMDGDLMKSIVDFMYTGIIELRLETVEALLKACDFLQMNPLITACSEFMLSNIDTSNCLGIASIAKLYRLDKLYEEARKFACKKFSEVGKGEEFLSLSVDQLEEFLPNIDECFAADVFLHLSAWVKRDKDRRLQSVVKLFSFVKFKFLSPEFIMKHRNVICDVEGGKELVFDWLEWHLSHKTSPEDNHVHSSGFVWRDQLCIVGGCSNIRSFQNVNLRTGRRDTLREMSIPRQRPGLTAFDDHVYVVGGIRNGSWCREGERFSFSHGIWYPIPNLNDPIVNIKLYATPDHLYAVGENSLERMELARNSDWTKIQHIVCDNRFFGTYRDILYTFTEEKDNFIIKKYVNQKWQLEQNANGLEIFFVDRMDQKRYFFYRGQWVSLCKRFS